jgi:hypothetical protein
VFGGSKALRQRVQVRIDASFSIVGHDRDALCCWSSIRALRPSYPSGHQAVGHLSELRATMAGICELVSRDPNADDRAQLDTTFKHLRELTRTMETEIHEAVLSCTRARRQMLEGILTEKPTIH